MRDIVRRYTKPEGRTDRPCSRCHEAGTGWLAVRHRLGERRAEIRHEMKANGSGCGGLIDWAGPGVGDVVGELKPGWHLLFRHLSAPH